MTVTVNQELREVFKDAATRVFLATVDEQGIPHLEEKKTIELDGDGQILVLEEGEYSRTNLNLVRSLWFDRRAVLHLVGTERRYELVVRPHKVHISGPVFERYYRQATRESEESPLSGVWVLRPERITEETEAVRTARDNAGRLPLVHLDRIAKRDPAASESAVPRK